MVEVTDNAICKEITARQVTQWPKKNKLSVSNIREKYVGTNMIGVVNWVPTNHTSSIATRLVKFLYIVGTKSKFDFGTYIFEQTISMLMHMV